MLTRGGGALMALDADDKQSHAHWVIGSDERLMPSAAFFIAAASSVFLWGVLVLVITYLTQ